MSFCNFIQFYFLKNLLSDNYSTICENKKKMKSLNISLEDISKVTGLSIDEIKNIKEV